MSDYTKHFALTPVGKNWKLLSPLPFDLGKKGSGLTVVVPAGFETDLATIPWFARFRFRSADARYAKAAVLPDFFLKMGFDPALAAAVFYQALRAHSVAEREAKVMFWAVWFKTV